MLTGWDDFNAASRLVVILRPEGNQIEQNQNTSSNVHSSAVPSPREQKELLWNGNIPAALTSVAISSSPWKLVLIPLQYHRSNTRTLSVVALLLWASRLQWAGMGRTCRVAGQLPGEQTVEATVAVHSEHSSS